MTPEQITALSPGQTLFDKGSPHSVKGLHVSRRRNAVSFMYYYRTRQGLERRPKIGSWPEITITEARSRAAALQSQIAIGEDPKGNWDKAKVELTLSEMFSLAEKKHWGPALAKGSTWAKEAMRLWHVELEPTFANHRLSQVSAVTISDWHKSKSDKPTTANRALAVLSKIFSLAEERALIKPGTNPCQAVRHNKEKKRRRYATAEEIGKIALILEREANNPRRLRSVAFIYLLIFSGSRPVAIEKAKREQLTTFDHSGETFGLLKFHGKSSGSTGFDEEVVLPPQAMEVLSKLKPDPEGYLVGINMPVHFWNEVRAEAGCPDLWARDWRRTFASVALSTGVGIDVVGELLNHQTTETTKIYAKLMHTARITAAAHTAVEMEKLLTGSRAPELSLPSGLPNDASNASPQL